MRDVAFDPRYFTYAADARDRAASVRLELGDARIRLDAVRRDRPEERYDVILVDAFSSDAIPVHLLTREALRLYFDMLGPRGIVALHISNRYLRLEPVVANLAVDRGYPNGGVLSVDQEVVLADLHLGLARLEWRTPEVGEGLAGILVPADVAAPQLDFGVFRER